MTILIVHWAALISAFLVLWFLSLFCLLPIGLGEVHPETGAPKNPRLLLKAGWATIIATVLWGIFYALILTRVVQI